MYSRRCRSPWHRSKVPTLWHLDSQGALAARDPHGFRPLCIGKIDGAYVISSETCGLDAVGATFLREVSPGEIVSVEMGRLYVQHRRQGLGMSPQGQSK
jgi:glutamine phosphoribosylpyrophosphate amidotransferase